MKRFFYLIIVLLVSFVTIRPLFVEGFFSMHDDTQVARVYEMGNALRDGMFPVRWVSDLGYGYGYPIFNFYGPLAYYIGGLLVNIGADALLATKLMIGFSMLLAGYSMFLLGKQLWGEKGGVFAAFFYVLAPFHAVDLYVRGAIGELLAYAIVPFVFYGLFRIVKDRTWVGVLVSGISFAGVITAHNLTAFMLLPFLVIHFVFLLVPRFSMKICVAWIGALLLGVGLSAFYWIPAIFEMSFTNVFSQIGGGADFRDHFVCLPQLWESMWGFGGSITGCLDGFSFRIGKLHILSVLAACVVFLTLFLRGKKIEEKEETFLFLFFSFLISIFFMLPISQPVWEMAKSLSFIQYPWRFLIFSSFFASAICGYLFNQVIIGTDKRYKEGGYILMAVSAIVCVLVYGKLFLPQTIYKVTAQDYTSKDNLHWRTSRISDEYLPKNFKRPSSEAELPAKTLSENSAITLKEVETKTQRKQYVVDVSVKTKLHANIAFFPSWKVFVDNEETSYIVTDKGIDIILPPGKHTVLFMFSQTLPQLGGTLISTASICALILGIIWKRSSLYAKIV